MWCSPFIQIGRGASDWDLQWVLSGYALTFGVVLVAAGRAGDILGRGPLFHRGRRAVHPLLGGRRAGSRPAQPEHRTLYCRGWDPDR